MKKGWSAKQERYNTDVYRKRFDAEVKQKTEQFAKLLDLSVSELEEMVCEDDYNPVTEMFYFAIVYREQRNETSNSRGRTFERNKPTDMGGRLRKPDTK